MSGHNKEKIKKAMTPKERRVFQDKLNKLTLIRSYTKSNLSEDMKVKRLQEVTEILLADDSKMEDVMLLDLGSTEELDAEITRVLQVQKDTINKDEIDALSGLEKKQIKELLARGLSINDIERFRIEVSNNLLPLEPEMLKDEIIIKALQSGKINPIEGDNFGVEVDTNMELTSNIMASSSDLEDSSDGQRQLDDFSLPGMEMVMQEEKDIPLTEEQFLRKIAEQTGYAIVEDERGNLEVSTIKDRMQITSKGGKFDDKYLEVLQKELEREILKYKRLGLDLSELEKQLRDKLEERISGTELIMTENQKDKIILKAITKEQRKKQEEKVDKEKMEVAEAIGVDPSEIISIIRFKSSESFGQIMNKNTSTTNTYVAIRFKNDKFKCYKEDESKKKGQKGYEEVSDYSVTPIMQELAPAMKDTAHSGITDVYAWEAKAGKSNGDSNRYDVVQIVIAGSNPNDDKDTIIRVMSNGDVTIDAVTNHGDGYDFDRNGVEISYPSKNMIIGGKEYEIHDKDTAEKEHSPKSQDMNTAVQFYQDVEKRIALLEELMEIDNLINDLENDKTPDLTIVAGKVIGGEGIKAGLEYSEESRQVQIDEAVSKRDSILNELGYNEEDLEYAKNEAIRMKESESEKTIYSNH